MAATYQVVLKDQSGERVALFDGWRLLRYHRERNWPDWIELQLDLPEERTTLFLKDCQVEVHRRGDWTDSEWYLDLETLHRRLDYQMLDTGQEYFTSRGKGYLELLTRRHGYYWIWNATDVEDGYLTLSGTPPEIIAQMVNLEAGPGAYYAFAGIDRRIPGLSVAAAVPAGEVTSARMRNTQLLTRIRPIADAAGLDLRVVGIGPGLFEFQVGDLLGDDHRWGNTDGNPPVVFSAAFGNMAMAHYVEDQIGEITHSYVAGVGELADRTMYNQRNEAAIAMSPWNLREGFFDGRDLNTDELLAAQATEILAIRGGIYDLGFQVLETDACRYGREWDLGDLVTGTYRNVTRGYQVEAIDIQVTNDGIETITVDLVAIS